MLCRGVGREFQLSSREDLGVFPVECEGKRMLATEVRGIFNALVVMGAIPIDRTCNTWLETGYREKERRNKVVITCRSTAHCEWGRSFSGFTGHVDGFGRCVDFVMIIHCKNKCSREVLVQF